MDFQKFYIVYAASKEPNQTEGYELRNSEIVEKSIGQAGMVFLARQDFYLSEYKLTEIPFHRALTEEQFFTVLNHLPDRIDTEMDLDSIISEHCREKEIVNR